MNKKPLEKLAKQFILKTRKGNKYIKTTPRKWSPEEEMFVYEKRKEGYTNAEIAEALGRSEISVENKYRRMRKRLNSYNESHRDEKYEANKKFYNLIKPKTILDLYAGKGKYWKQYKEVNVVSNDKDISIEGLDFHMDAEKLLHRKLGEDKVTKYDIVDIDPYGSPYNCLDGAIQLAKEGIIVSYGEVKNHKRLKRIDCVSVRYGIKKLEDFTVEALIKETQRIGKIHGKHLEPIIVCSWNGFDRVYYKISKITRERKDMQIVV